MANVKDIFTKVLPEDVVEYEVYYLPYKAEDDIDKVLQEYRIKCLALAASLTSDYIWVNEGFNLAVHKTKDESIPCLLGTTNFGEFIEDEWLIVSLLFQISEAYPELACRVIDNDGEFTLIEAADVLPKWLNPDTSKNRVFIHCGMLHIVPLPQTPGEILHLPTGIPRLSASLQAIQYVPGLTQAHFMVNECLQQRIEGLPGSALKFVQRTNVYIPELIAKVLDSEPDLVSAAARAFYYRDPIDLKCCRVFKHFPPETRIWCQVPMNRCSYSQLMQQSFQADRRSGYVIPKNAGADFKGMDLGSKLAHAFEILCASYRENGVNGNSFDEAAFQKYLDALAERDYFRGELEGSKLYKELLENARTYFIRMDAENCDNSGSVRVSAGKRIFSLKEDSANVALKRLSTATKRTDLPEETPDGWMYVDDKQMEEMLSGMKCGFEKLGRKDCNTNLRGESELSDLGETMQNFVSNMSSYEGIEVPSETEPINFDMDSFSSALNKILGPMGLTGGLTAKCRSDSLSDDFLSSESESETEEVGFEDEKLAISDFMKQMDDELAVTNVGKSFVKSAVNPKENGVSGSDSTNNDTQYEPVDINLNLVQNFLESCSSEGNLPGPATNLLHSLGLNTTAGH